MVIVSVNYVLILMIIWRCIIWKTSRMKTYFYNWMLNLNVKFELLSARQKYFIIKNLKVFRNLHCTRQMLGFVKSLTNKFILKILKFPFQPKNFEKSDSAFYCMRACARIQKPSFSRTRSILRLTFLRN